MVYTMMDHPFNILRPEYEQCLATMRVQRPILVNMAAELVLKPENLKRYIDVGASTGVPAALIGALDYRESGCNPAKALGQGDRWNAVSTHVPRGKGPFVSWQDAADFYVNYGHLNDASQPWTWAYVCWKGEAWNGFGPRNHGRHTGYLWACTSIYDGGKYIGDGQWDPKASDQQVGIIPLMRRLVILEPSLAFDKSPELDHVGSTPVPQAIPTGVGGGVHGTAWVQDALNKAFLPPNDPLLIDGNYGRRTREAVRAFQRFNKLVPDGLYGPATDAALVAMLNNSQRT